MNGELYPALRRPAPPTGLIKRIIGAAIEAWKDQDQKLFEPHDREPQPAHYLAEAERFLNQFLLAYFHSIIIVPRVPPAYPWKMMCDINPWLSRMPELWIETKKGCPLTRTQLDYVGGLLWDRMRGRV